MAAAVIAALTPEVQVSPDFIEGEAERMKQSENDPTEKMLYEPPKIVTISLRPEEAVLGNCKISGTGGPGQGACKVVTACSAVGS